MPIKRPERGFTLIEVIVALTILAIAMSAVIVSLNRHAGNARYLKDRTIAHWVAMNQLTEMRVVQAWPPPGRLKGKAAMANHEWHWQAEVIETPDPDMRRVDITVSENADESPLSTLTGYLARLQP